MKPSARRNSPAGIAALLVIILCLEGPAPRAGLATAPPRGSGGRRSLPLRSAPAARTTLPAAVPAPTLTAAQVSTVVGAAAGALGGDGLAIAVVDRAGRALAIFARALATSATRETALGLARAGGMFSSDQAPLSSRTVAFISREHFPPGIRNTAAGALFGIEHTNRGCDLNADFAPGSALPPATALDGVSPGMGPVTRPGGVPLFAPDGTGALRVVGGVGVFGAAGGALGATAEDTAHEYAACTGFAALFGLSSCKGLLAAVPEVFPTPAVIYLDGIELPFVRQSVLPTAFAPGDLTGAYDLGPLAGGDAPEGTLVLPRDGSLLTAAEVQEILDRAVATASVTRAAIRLPIGSRTRMTIAVADLDGTVLGLVRMPDGTVFSTDVAVSKARNVVWFSDPARPASELPGVPPGTAVTNRTLGFGSQPFFPSGIDGTAAGPFRPLFLFDAANPCTQGSQPASANQSGVVFFPGSAPLYKAGVLAGGLGVSGDGVEQDDFVAAGGAAGFLPADGLRADRIVINGVRLPYWKFPRNPTD